MNTWRSYFTLWTDAAGAWCFTEPDRSKVVGGLLRCNECGMFGKAGQERYDSCVGPATPYQRLVEAAFGDDPTELQWCGGWMALPHKFERGLP